MTFVRDKVYGLRSPTKGKKRRFHSSVIPLIPRQAAKYGRQPNEEVCDLPPSAAKENGTSGKNPRIVGPMSRGTFYQIGPQFQRFSGHALSDARYGIDDHRRKAFDGQAAPLLLTSSESGIILPSVEAEVF